MRIVVFVCLVLFTPALRACIWTYATDYRGKKIEVTFAGEGLVDSLRQHDSPSIRQNHRKRFEARKDKLTFEERNDYAVALLKVGETQKALAILEKLEREKPGLYATAANLGTAYELAGNNAEALRWIRESIARNPNAHAGTEWLHVRILEAKISGRPILGLAFGTGDVPNLPGRRPAGNTGKMVTVVELRDALQWQLQERYAFVNPPDPIMAELLYDWANLLFRTEAVESAVALYRESMRYGGVREREVMAKRLARAEGIVREGTLRKK